MQTISELLPITYGTIKMKKLASYLILLSISMLFPFRGEGITLSPLKTETGAPIIGIDVDAFAISPQDKYLAVISNEKCLNVFSLHTGTLKSSFQLEDVTSSIYFQFLQFSPGERYLCITRYLDSSRYQRKTQIFDLDKGKVIYTPLENSDYIPYQPFSPSDTKFIIGTENKTIDILDLNTLQRTSYPTIPFHDFWYTDDFVFFYQNDNQIASSIVEDETAYFCVWNLENGELTKKMPLEVEFQPIERPTKIDPPGIGYFGDQELIVLGNGRIQYTLVVFLITHIGSYHYRWGLPPIDVYPIMWDENTGKQIFRWEKRGTTYTSSYHPVLFANSGRCLLVHPYFEYGYPIDFLLDFMHPPLTKEELEKLPDGPFKNTSRSQIYAYSEQEQSIIFYDTPHTGEFIQYDLATRETQTLSTLYQANILFSIFPLNYPNLIVAASVPGYFDIWNNLTFQRTNHIDYDDYIGGGIGSFDNMLNTFDGSYLLCAGAEKISIFDTQDWQLSTTLSISKNVPAIFSEKVGVRIALSSDGQQLLATGWDYASGKAVITAWKVPDFTLEKEFQLKTNPIRFVQSIDNQTAAISDGNSVILVDINHEQTLLTFNKHQSPIQHVYYVNTIHKLLTVDSNRTAYLWDPIWTPITGEIDDTFENVNLPVRVLPDQGIAFFGSEIFDLEEKKTIALLEGEKMDYDYSQVSPDGQRMLIQSRGLGRIEPIGDLIYPTAVERSLFH